MTEIAEHEENLRKLKERCDKVSEELDTLYAKKKAIEVQEMIDAIELKFKNKGGNPGIFGKYKLRVSPSAVYKLMS